MTVLSISAALALAIQCAPGINPNLLVGIAKHESALDPSAIHRNTNGTIDYGLMQINSSNFGMLHLTRQTALDPCRSIRAAADLLQTLSRYNTGTPDRGIDNGYAQAVYAHVGATTATPTTRPATPPADIDDRPADPAGETDFTNGAHE